MQLFKRAGIYFSLVFGTGFVLGVIRVLVLVPRMGERGAELLELPWMICAIVLAARWINRRWVAGANGGRHFCLAYGLWALAFLLAAEFLLGYLLRGLSPVEAVLQRDPVAGTAYFVSLAIFGIMPWWLGRASKVGGSGAG